MVRFHALLPFAYIIFSFFLILLATPSCHVATNPISDTKNTTSKCIKVEREALLSFKGNLTDPSNRLASWVGDDCCIWIGVYCDSNTSHVVKLDLKNSFPSSEEYYFSYEDEEAYIAYKKSCFKGKISSSLLSLQHLSYLDLSMNNFSGSNIPKFLGSLKSLKYLNLSFSYFSKNIPPHLGNLSRLEYLDLNSFFHYIDYPKLEVKSLEWLANFPSLKYLNLGGANVKKVQNWFGVVNMLPFLVEVHLPQCGLHSLPPSIYVTNITSLSILDLSNNNFDSLIPHWLSNLSGLSTINLVNCSLQGVIPNDLGHLPNLQSLIFRRNNLIGKIPSSFANLCKLKTLDLAISNISGEISELVDGLSQCSNNISGLEYGYLNFNRLPRRNSPNLFRGLNSLETISLYRTLIEGSIPNSIGNLSSLQSLSLSYSRMKGMIPQSIGKLSNLVYLDLCGSSWEGVISETHFQNLTQLKRLLLGTSFLVKSSLVLDTKHDWVPPFKLMLIYLDRIQVGSKFPLWLKTQTELKILSLINLGISDTFPYELWMSCSKIDSWELSNNKLRGQVPHLQFPPSIKEFDLSFNNFEGPLPIFPSNLTDIILSNNMFSTPIPENINELLPKLQWLDLSSNLIHGGIPHSIRMLPKLRWLDLSSNLIHGGIPHSIGMLKELEVLILRNNSLSGNLPRSMRHLNQLHVLSLDQNNFQGEIPLFFRNYRYLTQLDLGKNKFCGKPSTWIGESLSSLLILSLGSNLFYGEIPQQLCLLSRLQILVIADNKFSGAIPSCIGNLIVYDDEAYEFSVMELVWRGREDVYYYPYFYSLDLSGNNLSGEIPENVTNILRLNNLNLSMNNLIGRIPEKIGNLRQLESLDLSRNKLFGHIPKSLSYLNFLSHLDLSFNNFSGRIPQGNQLQTLDNSSIYQGNPLLCGPPLLVNCSKNKIEPKSVPIKKNGIEPLSFYIGMIVGFIVGFWGVCGTLIFKTPWRQAYFGCFENLKDKIIVYVMVKIVCLQRKVKGKISGTSG